jgi:hypothetical protein
MGTSQVVKRSHLDFNPGRSGFRSAVQKKQRYERFLPVFEQFLYPENKGLGAKLSLHQTIAFGKLNFTVRSVDQNKIYHEALNHY